MARPAAKIDWGFDELKEGWWPMLLDGVFYGNKYTNHPVIVCSGNCD